MGPTEVDRGSTKALSDVTTELSAELCVCVISSINCSNEYQFDSHVCTSQCYSLTFGV